MAYPGKTTIEISGSTEEGAGAWLAAIGARSDASQRDAYPRETLEIDYARYGAGERELSWLDERLVMEDGGGLASDGGRCRRAVVDFILRFAEGLRSSSLAIGHMKLHISAGSFEGKVSLTAGDFLASAGVAELEALIGAQLPLFSARRALVAVNARVQASPEELSGLATAAAEFARRSAGIGIIEEDRSAFRPGMPEPTHRIP